MGGATPDADVVFTELLESREGVGECGGKRDGPQRRLSKAYVRDMMIKQPHCHAQQRGKKNTEERENGCETEVEDDSRERF